MCAMARSHARFIPLPVLIMSAFYLLCKARSEEACNQAACSRDAILGFGPTVTNKCLRLLDFLNLLVHHCAVLYKPAAHILTFIFCAFLHYLTLSARHFTLTLIGFIPLRLNTLLDWEIFFIRYIPVLKKVGFLYRMHAATQEPLKVL